MDKTINRNIVGTGLGLVISKSFIEMMDGKITLESEYGKGTVFTIAIPVVIGNRDKVKGSHRVKEEHSIYAPVLVVDDNEFNRKVARGLLSLMEIKAEVTESGAKAIELVKQKDYDVVFMDHMMPGLDGVETTLEIRKLGGKYENLPIVALTANAVSGAKEMFLKNKFNGFLSKPIDSLELTRILEIWLPPAKVQIKTEHVDSEDRAIKEDAIRKRSMVTFVKENHDTFEHITESLNSGDIKTAHRIAHTLKSCAGYLGKNDLSKAALSLELSLQAEPPVYSTKQLETLSDLLEEALREFEPMLKEAEGKIPEAEQIDAEEFTALLSEIRPLLEKGDFGASAYVEKLQGVIGMSELAERIDDYDFEGALETLISISEAQ
jgi:CheY-like chemotaxis protein